MYDRSTGGCALILLAAATTILIPLLALATAVR